jgi:hypothetical protein
MWESSRLSMISPHRLSDLSECEIAKSSSGSVVARGNGEIHLWKSKLDCSSQYRMSEQRLVPASAEAEAVNVGYRGIPRLRSFDRPDDIESGGGGIRPQPKK